MPTKIKKIGKLIGINLLVVLFLLTAVEVYFAYKLNHPETISKKYAKAYRKYYQEQDCKIIQTQATCARYDSGLFYTLKPGKFEYNNREFETTYEVNYQGFRDDEASLFYPKIIAIGDSYTMGWGVNQNETFAQIIENKLKLKVLNLGVSSYGTAREIKALDRIKTDSLTHLIVQYCPNDAAENKNYVVDDNYLKITPEHYYNLSVDNDKKRTSYYPFKHLLILPSYLFPPKNPTPPIIPEEYKPDTARLNALAKVNPIDAFLQVIKNAKDIPSKTKLILFSLEAEYVNNHFIAQVYQKLKNENETALLKQLSYIDFTGKLDSSHRFILDPHLNAKGHQVIAKEILNHLASN